VRLEGPCDYINASFIRGTDEEISQIAAQGPLPATVADFWAMLWQQRVQVVVMCSRTVENGKVWRAAKTAASILM
jgi:protein tyrosine phosphatase